MVKHQSNRIKYKGEIITFKDRIYWWNGRPFMSLSEVKRIIDIFN